MILIVLSARTYAKMHPLLSELNCDLYFLTALHQNGKNFETKLNNLNVNTIQFAFNFDRVNNWGGFINTGLYLVNYDTDTRIIKSNHSR